MVVYLTTISCSVLPTTRNKADSVTRSSGTSSAAEECHKHARNTAAWRHLPTRTCRTRQEDSIPTGA